MVGGVGDCGGRGVSADGSEQCRTGCGIRGGSWTAGGSRYRDGRFIYLGRGACIGGGLFGRRVEKAGLARLFYFFGEGLWMKAIALSSDSGSWSSGGNTGANDPPVLSPLFPLLRWLSGSGRGRDSSPTGDPSRRSGFPSVPVRSVPGSEVAFVSAVAVRGVPSSP